MDRTDKYPYSLKSVLQESPHENILDSNMFTAYIPRGMDIPRLAEPRSAGTPNTGKYRYPGQIRSAHINQVFSCIGYIKRTRNPDHLKYLPALYEELGRFLLVMQDIAYNLDVRLTLDIYEAQKRGFESFFSTYHDLRDRDAEWVCMVRKHQMIYLEQIDMLIETLKARGKVFEHRREPLYAQVLSACRELTDRTGNGPDTAAETGCSLVANSCARAALDGEPKVIWSGDMQVLKLLRHIYTIPGLKGAFPQIYMRASYDPMDFAELFPDWHGRPFFSN